MAASGGGVGSVLVDVQMRTAQISRDVEKIKKELASLGGAADTAGALFKRGIAAFAIDQTIVGPLQRMINQIDDVGDLGAAFGISAQQVNILAGVAKASGIELEQLGKIFDKFSTRLSEAQGGDPQALLDLKAIGLTMDDIKSKDFDAVLRKALANLDKFEGGANKVALLRDNFSKSGRAMDEFASKVARLTPEIEKIGGAFDDESVQKVDTFKEQVALLTISFEKLKLEILNELLPTLNAMAKGFLDALRAGEGFFGGLLGAAKGLVVGDEIARTRKEIDVLATTMASVDKRLKSTSISKTLRAELEEEKKVLLEEQATYKAHLRILTDPTAITGETKPATPRVPAPPRINAGKSATDAKALADEAIKQFERQIKEQEGLQKHLNEVDKILLDQNLITLDQFYAQREERAQSAAANIVASYEAQIAQLRALDGKLVTQADKAANRTKIAELADKIGDIYQTLALEGTKSFFEQEEAVRKYARTLNDLKADVADLQGNTVLSVKLRIESQQEDLRRQFKLNPEALALLDEQKRLLTQQSDNQYAQQVAELNAQLLELQGRFREAAEARDAFESEAFLKQAINRGDQGAVDLDRRLRDRKILSAEINEITRESTLIQERLGNQEARLRTEQDAGSIGQLTFLQRASAARQAAIPELQRLADKYVEIANAPGSDARLRQDADNFKLIVDEMIANADLVKNKFDEIADSALADFFTDVATGAKTAKEAFNDFTNSIVRDVTSLVSQDISKKLFKGIFGDEGSFGTIASKLISGSGGGVGTPGSASFVGPLQPGSSGGGFLDSILGFLGGFFRAEGGPVAAAQPYVVGERGPEIFVPSTAGRIETNDVLRSIESVTDRSASEQSKASEILRTMEAIDRERVSASVARSQDTTLSNYVELSAIDHSAFNEAAASVRERYENSERTADVLRLSEIDSDRKELSTLSTITDRSVRDAVIERASDNPPFRSLVTSGVGTQPRLTNNSREGELTDSQLRSERFVDREHSAAQTAFERIAQIERSAERDTLRDSDVKESTHRDSAVSVLREAVREMESVRATHSAVSDSTQDILGRTDSRTTTEKSSALLDRVKAIATSPLAIAIRERVERLTDSFREKTAVPGVEPENPTSPIPLNASRAPARITAERESVAVIDRMRESTRDEHESVASTIERIAREFTHTHADTRTSIDTHTNTRESAAQAAAIPTTLTLLRDSSVVGERSHTEQISDRVLRESSADRLVNELLHTSTASTIRDDYIERYTDGSEHSALRDVNRFHESTEKRDSTDRSILHTIRERIERILPSLSRESTDRVYRESIESLSSDRSASARDAVRESMQAHVNVFDRTQEREHERSSSVSNLVTLRERIERMLAPMLPHAREEGGPVTANSTYLVGESGPEIFVPTQSGTIIPNNVVERMRSQNVIDISRQSAIERLRSSSVSETATRMYEMIMDPLAVAHRAMGGGVSAGVPYWVGEVGPEIFTPKGSGGSARSSSGDTYNSQHIEINVPQGTSHESASQIAARIGRQLDYEMSKNG